jgi:hypothetical protein
MQCEITGVEVRAEENAGKRFEESEFTMKQAKMEKAS